MPPEKTVMPPKPVEDWWRIDAKATEGEKTKAKIHIYDAIGGWFGIRVSELVKALADLDVDEIDLYVNSPGGDAFGGLAIMNALRRHPATVTVHVDGLAASAASAIALGGDVVEMGRGAQLMIHDASMIAWGPAATMTKTAEILDKLSDSYAAVYAEKAGDGDVKRWRKAMLAESWYTAQEAVDAGLADRVIDQTAADEDADEADAEAAWQGALALYRYAGRSQAPAPNAESANTATAVPIRMSATERHPLARFGHPTSTAATAVAASPAPGDETQPKENSMAFMDDVRQRLGADADADEAGLLEALDKRLTATAEPPAGTMLIDKTVYDGLRADAAAGREAREQQINDRRDDIIATAQRQGRITAASAAAFRAQLDKDEDGTTAILATLPANTAVPVEELGIGQAGDVISEEDKLWAKAQAGEEKTNG